MGVGHNICSLLLAAYFRMTSDFNISRSISLSYCRLGAVIDLGRLLYAISAKEKGMNMTVFPLPLVLANFLMLFGKFVNPL